MTTIETNTNTNTNSHTLDSSPSPSSSSTSFTTTSSTSPPQHPHHSHSQQHQQPISIKQWLSRRIPSQQRPRLSKPSSSASTSSSKHLSSQPDQQQQQQQQHPHLPLPLHIQQTQDEERLADSYAAYCRDFTSGPGPEYHTRSISDPAAPSLNPNITSMNRNFHRDMNMNTDMNVDAASADIMVPPASFNDDFDFLPVGAHGFQPLRPSFVRQPSPSPPPGILTPARYEEEARLRREEEQARKNENKQKRLLTWRAPIRLSLLKWWRIKAMS